MFRQGCQPCPRVEHAGHVDDEGLSANNPGMPMRWKELIVAMLALTAWIGSTRDARAQGAPDVAKNEPYEWDNIFPIFGHKLASKGVKFPLPLGIGVNFIYLKQDIDISGLQVAANDRQYTDLTDVIEFDHVTTDAFGVNLRADLWLFPFLNVYGLLNYVFNIETDVLVAEPFPLQAGATQTAYGAGFGATAAFGYWGFFWVLDLNFTWNNPEQLDTAVTTIIFAPRAGKRFELSRSTALSGWIGAMRMSVDSDSEGSMPLSEALGEPSDDFKAKLSEWYNGLPPAQQAAFTHLVDGLEGPGDPVINYKLDKAIADPWNMLLGAELDFSRKLQIRAEAGFIGRFSILVGLNYRLPI